MSMNEIIERSYYVVDRLDRDDGTVLMEVMPDHPNAAAAAIGAVLRELGKGLVFIGEGCKTPGEVYCLNFRKIFHPEGLTP